MSNVSDEGFLPRGLRGRTVVTADTFFHPVYVSGRRSRWEGDADWAMGPASLRADTRVTDQRLRTGHAIRICRMRDTNRGHRRRVRVEARRKGRAPSAVARYERVWFDSVGARDGPLRSPRAETIFPSGERVLTLGVNWALNRWIKLQLQRHERGVERSIPVPRPTGPASGAGCFASSSRCRGRNVSMPSECRCRRRAGRSRFRARRRPDARPAACAFTAALFDDTVVHEIRLAINSERLGGAQDRLPRQHLLSDRPPLADQVVRNIGIRSRGTGSRSGINRGFALTSISTTGQTLLD